MNDVGVQPGSRFGAPGHARYWVLTRFLVPDCDGNVMNIDDSAAAGMTQLAADLITGPEDTREPDRQSTRTVHWHFGRPQAIARWHCLWAAAR
jgi:hypothetical protein